MKAPGDLTEDELDEALDALYARAQLQQETALFQLVTISTAVHQFAAHAITHCLELSEDVLRKSEDLKNVIRDYFQSEGEIASADLKSLVKKFLAYFLIILKYFALITIFDKCSPNRKNYQTRHR